MDPVLSLLAPPPDRSPENGQFVAGNRVAKTPTARQRSARKRAVSRAVLAECSPKVVRAMVRNLVRIASNPTSTTAATRAFAVLADCLGLKESTLQILRGSETAESPDELRTRLFDRLEELKAEEQQRAAGALAVETCPNPYVERAQIRRETVLPAGGEGGSPS